MKHLNTSIIKKMGDLLKRSCRILCSPLLPYFSDSTKNRLPFLGQVCIPGPQDIKIKFNTYGKYGKDRIAIKLARHGIDGYEPETVRVLYALIKKTSTFIDIGAHTGIFSLLAAFANPKCQVVAFEPVPFIFEMLKKNIKLNKLHNLKSVAMAISDRVGRSPFYITRTKTGVPKDSSLRRGFREQTEICYLDTITLDQYVDQHAIASLELLKIDVESAEEQVFRGALKTIRRDRPFIICEVLKNFDHGYIQHILQELHYRFYHITLDGLEYRHHLDGFQGAHERNYLFVPTEREHELSANIKTT